MANLQKLQLYYSTTAIAALLSQEKQERAFYSPKALFCAGGGLLVHYQRFGIVGPCLSILLQPFKLLLLLLLFLSSAWISCGLQLVYYVCINVSIQCLPMPLTWAPQ